MDEETKRKVCRLVAGMVACDEDFDDRERAFVDKVLTQFGIPEEEWDAIFPLLEADEATATLQSMAPEVQAQAFELLLDAAAADGVIADEEKEYLNVVAKVVGVSEDELETRLAGRI